MNPNNPSSGTSRRTILVTLAAAPALPQLLLPIRAQAQAQPTPSSTTLDARQFAGTHAGTTADPWPGSAIKAAIDSLSDATGTVFVANGIWNVASLLTINRDNWTLQGESRDGAVIQFTGTGQLWFGSERGISKATFTGLFFRGDTLTQAGSPQSGLRISNAKNCSFNNNKITGHQNGSIPAVFFEGGDTVTITKNLIIGAPTGAASLQLQALGGTADSGFVVTENEWDSGNIVLIGLDNVQVTKNYMHNKTLGNMIAIMACGRWNEACYNVTIDGNTVDAGGANGAIITGLPNDLHHRRLRHHQQHYQGHWR